MGILYLRDLGLGFHLYYGPHYWLFVVIFRVIWSPFWAFAATLACRASPVSPDSGREFDTYHGALPLHVPRTLLSA